MRACWAPLSMDPLPGGCFGFLPGNKDGSMSYFYRRAVCVCVCVKSDILAATAKMLATASNYDLRTERS